MEVFKGRVIWVAGQSLPYLPLCADLFRLVGGEITGQCSRNLVLSLKLPSSTWVGALVPTENSKVLLCIFLRRNQDPAPQLHYLFLDCSSFVSAFPSFPDKQLFESVLWNSWKVKEAEWILFPTNKKWGTQKGFVPGRAPQGPAPFHIHPGTCLAVE